jgi:energy-converting hydrogenase Eha subunit C
MNAILDWITANDAPFGAVFFAIIGAGFVALFAVAAFLDIATRLLARLNRNPEQK